MAGAGFIRRFGFDPGSEVIEEIEGVVIIDREPPASITGVGSSTVLVVGEFENGEFETPLEVVSGPDLLSTFGGFGYSYDGVPGNNPSARGRKADGALNFEYWNGNGFISLVNKRYRRLIITRVDTSVGSVRFTRLACATGNNLSSWPLTSGASLNVDINGGGPAAAVFTGVVAQLNSAAGVYPTLFTGGETMTVIIDNGTDQQIGPIDVVFLASDQTQAQVVARINSFLGYAAASVQGGGVTRLSGRIAGTSGNVNTLGVDAAVIAAVGFTANTGTNGTGNVGDISKVTLSEAKTIIEAAIANTLVQRDVNGNIEVCNTDTTGAPSTILIYNASTVAGIMGFDIGVLYSDAEGVDGVIPAGTRVRNGGGDEWVTMQDVAVDADDNGPYNVKVRPGNDDGTALGAATATVTVMPFPVLTGMFDVTNITPLTAAMTEAAIDAAYSTALDSTLNPSSVARLTNIVIASRQSNIVRNALRNNAINASANGLRGRSCVVRPPLNTTRAIARGSLSPGVGATRAERTWYAYPGAATFIPQIAQRGLDGGAGFTADGIIDTGFDAWVASVCSQLPPEEDPGQLTEFMAGILAVERGNADVQNLTMQDYILFKAAGIAALRMDEGTAIIQSGVTSVDPVTLPNLTDINRRRMADFIQDSQALRLNAFVKKLGTRDRRTAVFGECKAFLDGLKSVNNPSSQRIENYSIDAKSGNTQDSLGRGQFRIIQKIRTISSMKYIILDVTVGTQVTITEVAA